MTDLDGTKDHVLVVGAGPVGLSAALRLGRAGVRVRVLERDRTPSDQPRAHVVNARTMELFRSWGIADGIRADGLKPEMARSFAWLTQINAPEIVRLDYISDEAAEYHSPERLCSVAQDLIELRLRAAVDTLPYVSVETGREVVGYRETEGGAELDVRDSDGATSTEAARFVLACDGASSRLRKFAGVGIHQSMALSRRINIYFHADLTEYTRNRPFILWFVHHVQTQGIFIMLAKNRWVYSVEMAEGQVAADYDLGRCRHLVRAAVGVPGLEPQIRSVLAWKLDMGVADAFRQGPLFLVGDAAHRFPPMGGFGMNSGIQDADNLAWKLAAVLAGRASVDLLDSYEAERKPVAEYNATQCMLNAERDKQAARQISSPEVLALLAAPEGAELRAGMAAGISTYTEEIHSQGQQFGAVYCSSALVDDGSPARTSTISDYQMTARPGARAPHTRLLSARGDIVSSIELVTGGWTVMAAGPVTAWRAAADQVGAMLGLNVRTCGVLSTDAPSDDDEYRDAVTPGRWSELYELHDGGAVLVRPDGHVAARWKARPDNAVEVLRDVFDRVLAPAAALTTHA